MNRRDWNADKARRDDRVKAAHIAANVLRSKGGKYAERPVDPDAVIKVADWLLKPSGLHHVIVPPVTAPDGLYLRDGFLGAFLRGKA